MVAALVIGGLFLLGMVIVTGYAVAVLPAGSRMPLNAGVPEYSVWVSRWAGLAAWLGVGVVVYAILGSLTASAMAGNWEPSVRMLLLPAAMLVVLTAEAGAVITARKRLGAETVVAAGAEAAATESPAGTASEAAPEAAPAGTADSE